MCPWCWTQTAVFIRRTTDTNTAHTTDHTIHRNSLDSSSCVDPSPPKGHASCLLTLPLSPKGCAGGIITSHDCHYRRLHFVFNLTRSPLPSLSVWFQLLPSILSLSLSNSPLPFCLATSPALFSNTAKLHRALASEKAALDRSLWAARAAKKRPN